MGHDAVDRGRRGGPFAFIVPPEQHDPYATARLENLLLAGAIEIHRALEPFRADGDPYPAGTDVILLAQPYRSYVKTLLEQQKYPVARRDDPGVPRERPYDVAGWTLPAQMGVDVRTIERTFEPPAMQRLTVAEISPAKVWSDTKPAFYIVDARGNGGAIAVNRLHAAGLQTAWTTADTDVGGFRYARGSIIVPFAPAAKTAVEKVAQDLGLRADGLKGKPPVSAQPIGSARIALYRPWVANVDEGWARLVLEQHEFSFASLVDSDIRAGSLRAKFDAIILPSSSAEKLIAGHPPDSMPPEYVGGLGPSGVDALKTFVESGGTLITLDESTAFARAVFDLPLRDVTRNVAGEQFFCPGSILRLDLDPSDPLAYGMSEHTGAFFGFSSAFEPIAAAGRQVPLQTPARYAAKDVLLSGWLEGEGTIAGRAAVLTAAVGQGRVVLLGFPVEHRGQSLATFRLLFNALLTAQPPAPARTH
jgi:hypothetical protein